MKNKKVLVLGVKAVENQAVIQAALGSHSVTFVSSREAALAKCCQADIFAVGLDHKDSVPELLKKGFNGIIVPLLTGNKKSGIMFKGKVVDPVSIRDLPDHIHSLFRQPEALAT